MKAAAVILALLLAGPVLAADRHVYLDTDADGQLNDCPNSAHNAKGTSNTDELEECIGGTSEGKIIGTAIGRVSSATCTGGGGAVAALNNGDTADADADGTIETVYGHPQACVLAMATSDSCEVHSGTYRASGAYADSNALNSGTDPGPAGVGETADLCEKNTCWFATVLAPGPASGAYGTAGSPGYLRGAVMNSSTDTWDSDGDKIPDTEAGEPTSYPVIFSGDRDNDSVFDATTGLDADNDGTFDGTGRGDAFLGVVVGCNATTTDSYNWCGSGHSDNPWLDTDANGTFDQRGNYGQTRNPAYLIIKDIEFTKYNGGHALTSGGVRTFGASISLDGDGSTDGLQVDHIYRHGNDYSLQASSENWWADFGDDHNGSCTSKTVIKNSLIEQNNEKVLDDDCGVSNPCGCPKDFNNNRVITNITSSRATGRSLVVYFYLKSIDTFNGGVKKVHRIWNNEFINDANNGGGKKFMDLQAFGNSMTQGLGELWVYGNIFRDNATDKLSRFWSGSCDIGTGSWRLYFFNNTFDSTFTDNTDGIWRVCNGSTGELIVEKNNAYWSSTTNINTHDSSATTDLNLNEYCSTADTGCTTPSLTARTDWWDYTSPGLYGALTAYKTKAGGPLDNITANAACDPDADGVPGVDYDWDGANDTSWTDIAGNVVSCPTTGSPLDIGAVQSSSVGGEVCGNNVQAGLEDCDGTDLDGQTCQSLGFFAGTLGCTGICTFDTSGCTSAPVCGNDIREGAEPCDGTDLNGQTCTSLGFASGDLFCSPNCDQFDTGDCVTPPTQTCGNNTVEGTEACDGSDLDGKNCVSYLGILASGTLSCNANCTPNLANCDTGGLTQTCGNTVKNAGEACDHTDLGGQSCTGLGYASGPLTCNPNCTFNTAECVVAPSLSPNSGGPKKNPTKPTRPRRKTR